MNIWGLITEILLLLIDEQSHNQTELISWGLFYVLQYFYYAFGCGGLSHVIVFFLGASACMKLRLFGVAIKWCDEGLTVSFDFKTFSACLCINTQYQYHN